MIPITVNLPTANIPVLLASDFSGTGFLTISKGKGPFTIHLPDGTRIPNLRTGSKVRLRENLRGSFYLESQTVEQATVLLGSVGEDIGGGIVQDVRILDENSIAINGANRFPVVTTDTAFLRNWLFTTPADGAASDVTANPVRFYSCCLFGRDATGNYGTPATAWDVRFEGTFTTASGTVWTELMRHSSGLGHTDGQIVFQSDAIPRPVRTVRARLVSVTLGAATDVQAFLYSVR